jgi:hypothetical protein
MKTKLFKVIALWLFPNTIDIIVQEAIHQASVIDHFGNDDVKYQEYLHRLEDITSEYEEETEEEYY